MAISRSLAPPIVSAAIAMIAVTNFATVKIVKGDMALDSSAFFSIWPIALSSAVAVILVMSFLYRSLMDLIGDIKANKDKASPEQLTQARDITQLQNKVCVQRTSPRQSAVD